MSNYTLAVNWSGKDGLSDADAAKVISGSDFNSEFTTVRTAINSKADLNGSATEAFSCTTASSGTNTTQTASTAFVTAATAAITAAFINNLVYPVGSIYTNMAVATNPATLLGMGTWVAYATGQVLVGIESSGTFDTLDESLGAETHTLSVAELPSHTHNTVATTSTSGTLGSTAGGYPTNEDNTSNVATSATGSGTAHSNLQPSVTVYMWKRTA